MATPDLTPETLESIWQEHRPPQSWYDQNEEGLIMATPDLTQLSPAPWEAKDWRVCSFPIKGIAVVCDTANNQASRNDENKANAAFIAMARNAFAGDPEALAWWEANRTNPRPDPK